MGGEHSVIRNLDKRTARREHASHFKQAISRFRAYNEKHLRSLGILGLEGSERCRGAGRQQDTDHEGNSHATDGDEAGDDEPGDMRVCVRKRPIHQHELTAGEYDVISCLFLPNHSKVVVHDARMHPDMKRMFMDHHGFCFDRVFHEASDNRQVYEGTAASLVKQAVQRQVISTVMMYGQTGSGKTFTMSAIYNLACNDLFKALEEGGSRGYSVTVSFVELAGDRCSDMLNRGRQTQLLTGRDGAVHPYPTAEIEVHNADELYKYIQFACSLRATEATGVHDHSSRSHAICRIYIKKEENEAEGVLQLVDLAGSEQRIDSDNHGSARRKESAQINSSLSALKECIRCKAAGGKFMPYRKSKLTHCLRACFDENNPTTVIATVSPSSKDTEHSLNTLRHANIMDGNSSGPAPDAGPSHVTGGEVNREMIGELNLTQLARQKKAERMAGQTEKDTTGKIGSEQRFKQEELSLAEIAKIREKQLSAAERTAYRALASELQKQLQQARQEIGNNPRQNGRLLKYSMRAQLIDDDDESALAFGQEGSNIMQDSTDDGEGPRATAGQNQAPRSQDTSTRAHSARRKAAVQVAANEAAENEEPHRLLEPKKGDKLVRKRSARYTEQVEGGSDFRGPNPKAETSVPSSHHNDPVSLVDKQQEVARRRNEINEKQRKALEEKVQNKSKRSSGATMKPALMGIEKIEDEIASLSEELKLPGLSQAKSFAIKKKIAMCRAECLKLQRKRDAERAEMTETSTPPPTAPGGPDVTDSLEILDPMQTNPVGQPGSYRNEAESTRRPVQGAPCLAANRRAMSITTNQQHPETRRMDEIAESNARRHEASWDTYSSRPDRAPEQNRTKEASRIKSHQAGRNPSVRSLARLEGVKGLSPEVVSMLEGDADAFREVVEGRELRTCLNLWRQQAEIGAMSYR